MVELEFGLGAAHDAAPLIAAPDCVSDLDWDGGPAARLPLVDLAKVVCGVQPSLTAAAVRFGQCCRVLGLKAFVFSKKLIAVHPPVATAGVDSD